MHNDTNFCFVSGELDREPEHLSADVAGGTDCYIISVKTTIGAKTEILPIYVYSYFAKKLEEDYAKVKKDIKNDNDRISVSVWCEASAPQCVQGLLTVKLVAHDVHLIRKI